MAAEEQRFLYILLIKLGVRRGVRGWLRHCARGRKVPGSISEGLIGIFHWLNPSDPTMTIGSTQALRVTSTMNISCE